VLLDNFLTASKDIKKEEEEAEFNERRKNGPVLHDARSLIARRDGSVCPQLYSACGRVREYTLLLSEEEAELNGRRKSVHASRPV
jgi:hypothetical protein